MNKIEHMHLDAINDSYHTYRLDEEDDSIVDTVFLENKAAFKSSEITEQIAIEFADWLIKELILSSHGKYLSHTPQELFQEFLKTKQ